MACLIGSLKLRAVIVFSKKVTVLKRKKGGRVMIILFDVFNFFFIIED